MTSAPRVSGDRLPASTSTMRPRSMVTLPPATGRGSTQSISVALVKTRRVGSSTGCTRALLGHNLVRNRTMDAIRIIVLVSLGVGAVFGSVAAQDEWVLWERQLDSKGIGRASCRERGEV